MIDDSGYTASFEVSFKYKVEENGDSLIVCPIVSPYFLRNNNSFSNKYLFQSIRYVYAKIEEQLKTSSYMKEVNEALPAREYALSSWHSWGEVACFIGWQAESLLEILEAGAEAERKLRDDLLLADYIEPEVGKALEELKVVMEELEELANT